MKKMKKINWNFVIAIIVLIVAVLGFALTTKGQTAKRTFADSSQVFMRLMPVNDSSKVIMKKIEDCVGIGQFVAQINEDQSLLIKLSKDSSDKNNKICFIKYSYRGGIMSESIFLYEKNDIWYVLSRESIEKHLIYLDDFLKNRVMPNLIQKD